jgi:hypothetical protein
MDNAMSRPATTMRSPVAATPEPRQRVWMGGLRPDRRSVAEFRRSLVDINAESDRLHRERDALQAKRRTLLMSTEAVFIEQNDVTLAEVDREIEMVAALREQINGELPALQQAEDAIKLAAAKEADRVSRLVAAFRAKTEPLYVELANKIAALLPEAVDVEAAWIAFRKWQRRMMLDGHDVAGVDAGPPVSFHKGIVLPDMNGTTGSGAIWDRRRRCNDVVLPHGVVAHHE